MVCVSAHWRLHLKFDVIVQDFDKYACLCHCKGFDEEFESTPTTVD